MFSEKFLMKKNYIIVLSLFVVFKVNSQQNEKIDVVIQSYFDTEIIKKDTWYLSENNDSIQFSKLQFYLTNFILITSDDENIKVENSNYLVDIFNKSSPNISLENTSNKEIKSVSFNIGVEEHMNTDGALSGDLDPSKGMYWSWQSGYVNFKVEGKSPSCKTRKNKFQFHIGGYLEPYQTTRNVAFTISKNKVILKMNLATLFNQIKLSQKNQVMIPGKEAHKIANLLPKLFSVDE